MTEQTNLAADPCPLCGGCPGCDPSLDEKHLATLNDLEEACRLITGLLDAFDNWWTGDKPPPRIYYRSQHFLDQMLPHRIAGDGGDR